MYATQTISYENIANYFDSNIFLIIFVLILGISF